MADVHTKETRSYNMSRIKGKNTKPKYLCVVFFMRMATGTAYTIKNYPLPNESLTNGIRSFNPSRY
jgi:DNA mismatch endonuclease, patch repair protein